MTFSKFERDPEALAWAREKVQRTVDRLRGSEQAGWKSAAFLVEHQLIGGDGCMIAAFDERNPQIMDAIDGPVRPEPRWTIWFDHPTAGRKILVNDVTLEQMGWLGHWANLEHDGYPYGIKAVPR